jgi:DNA-binding NarL/FixJ family response regulator
MSIRDRQEERFTSLSPKQLEVTELLMRGKSNKEIANAFNISLSAVKHRVTAVLSKLQIDRRNNLWEFMKLAPSGMNGNEKVQVLPIQ